MAAGVAERERGRVLPAVGNAQAGGAGDVIALPSLGVEQHLIPAEHQEFLRCGGPGGEAADQGGGFEIVKVDEDLVLACRHFDMNGPAVQQIAAPFQRPAAGREFQSGKVGHGAVRRVLAGNPFGVIERQRAWGGRNPQPCMENLARGLGGVDRDRNVWACGSACGHQ